MKERAEHFEAFEIYYAMGGTRSYVKLAKEIGRSFTTIERWGGAFKWQARVLERDRENAILIAEANNKKIVEDTLKYRSIIQASVETFVRKLKQGGVEVSNVKDLVSLVRLDLELMGEFTDMSIFSGEEVSTQRVFVLDVEDEGADADG